MTTPNEIIDDIAEKITLGKQNFLFIGASGTGKTYAAAHLNPPALFLNTEGGLRTIARSDIADDCREIDLQNEPKPWEWFLNHLPALIEQTQFKTIVVDSLSGLSTMFYRQVAGPNPNQSHTLKTYGTTIDRLRQIVRKLNTACANVIWICTETAITNDAGIIESYIPNVAGKETFARQVPAEMDQVWFFVIKEEVKNRIINGKAQKEVKIERVILTAPTGKRIGKDRDSVLELEEELDFEMLRKKLLLTNDQENTNEGVNE